MTKIADQETHTKAYTLAFKLIDSGLNEEAIMARLEKEGIPETLRAEVTSNVLLQRKKENIKKYESYFFSGVVVLASGVVITAVSYFITGTLVMIPFGLMIGGAASIVYARSKMN